MNYFLVILVRKMKKDMTSGSAAAQQQDIIC